MDVTSGFIAMELHSQETGSITFLLKLYFFGTETFPKLKDVFLFGALEEQVINIDNSNDMTANEEAWI